jgi:hypothetical protein
MKYSLVDGPWREATSMSHLAGRVVDLDVVGRASVRSCHLLERLAYGLFERLLACFVVSGGCERKEVGTPRNLTETE